MSSNNSWTVEGYWDCPYCNNVRIKGRHRTCPNCGHPRDASTRFYTLETDKGHAMSRDEFRRLSNESDTGQSTLPNTKDMPADTSDWLCEHCDSYNRAWEDTCRSCGAPRDGTSTYRDRNGTEIRTYDSNETLVSVKVDDLPKRPNKTETTDDARDDNLDATARKGNTIGEALSLIVLLVVCAMLAVWTFSPHPRTVTVSSFDWTRDTEIEVLKTFEEKDWSLPPNARLLQKSQEIHHYDEILDHYETKYHIVYDHVLDHYETKYRTVYDYVLDHYETYQTTKDNGDGTFDVSEDSRPVYKNVPRQEAYREPVYKNVPRQEAYQEPVYQSKPVYQTQYHYEIERWVHARDVHETGDDHEPTETTVTLSPATGEHGTGKERKKEPTTEYGVTDNTGKTPVHYTAPYEIWEKLELGSTVNATVDSHNRITSIN